jgi:hypothetical protein
MKILRATFLGMKGIRDVALDFEDPETGEAATMVALVGPAAAGKTRVLEAIFAAKEAIAPYGAAIDGGLWIGAGMSAKASITFVLDEEEQTYAGTADPIAETDVIFLPRRTDSLASDGLRAVLERYTHGAGAGKFEYFPATRRLSLTPPFGELTAHAQRTKRASRSPSKYDFVGRFLRDLPATPHLGDAFGQALTALSSTCRYEPNGRPGRYFSSKGGDAVSLGELSDAEGDAVLLAATTFAIDLRCSVLLADRPDMYVDPRDARRFAAGLKGLGGDNQIILAAASPRFAEAAAAEGALAIELEAP